MGDTHTCNLSDVTEFNISGHTIAIPKYIFPIYKQYTGCDIDEDEVRRFVMIASLPNDPETTPYSDNILSALSLYSCLHEVYAHVRV